MKEIDPLYLTWKKKKTPDNMAAIVNKYIPLLKHELPKYKGNLPTDNLKAFGKKFVIDAVKTYNPDKGQLSTHIVTNLQRLHRVNYETSSIIRSSEELQRGTNQYRQAKEYLTDKYSREPTFADLADHLGWSISRVARTDRAAHQDILSSTMEVSPTYTEMDDPRFDYVYHDLTPEDKIIFQHKIGYKGASIMSNNDIAKKLKVAPSNVSNRSAKIAKLVKDTFGMGS